MNRSMLAIATTGVALLAIASGCTSSKPAESGGDNPAANPDAPAASGVAAPATAKNKYNLHSIQGVPGD